METTTKRKATPQRTSAERRPLTRVTTSTPAIDWITCRNKMLTLNESTSPSLTQSFANREESSPGPKEANE